MGVDSGCIYEEEELLHNTDSVTNQTEKGGADPSCYSSLFQSKCLCKRAMQYADMQLYSQMFMPCWRQIHFIIWVTRRIAPP